MQMFACAHICLTLMCVHGEHPGGGGEGGGRPVSQVLGDFFDSAVFNCSFLQIMLIHDRCGFTLSACSAAFWPMGAACVANIFLLLADKGN